ncbi:small ribosomal subunit Rsm22 family protein [Aestuariivirga sp.]|uniref:small ribosomal subunit Rsm22 family protein n=1 Tax=Aestuariivirga sp. TaxID=2650926 RepID=UPI003BA84462
MTFPPGLQQAVAGWLERQNAGAERRAQSAALSATYRQGGSSRSIDLGAYLVARLPATFAAVSRVLAELQQLRPDLAPASLLDVGSGPGTASWAAAGCWPGLQHVTFLDNSPGFLELATELAGHGSAPLRDSQAIRASFEALPDGLSADLVIAAYALAEIPVAKAAAAATGLWRASRSALVLVEPGTPQGFARIRAARVALLDQGAVPVAPCTHALACPIAGDDWCHFSIRLARSRAHMHAKGARVPFEDERFSYLVLARDGEPSRGARILSPPVHGKPGTALRLCTQGSIEPRHIARRDAAAYKLVKKMGWGDLIHPQSDEEKAP